MTIETGVVLVGAVQLLALGAAWGHMVAMVRSQREIANERHRENLQRLDEIREDVKETNGTVHEHSEYIRILRELKPK